MNNSLPQHILDILPTPRKERMQEQAEAVARIKGKSIAFGSVILTESKSGDDIVLRVQAKTGQIVAVSVHLGGAYDSKLEAK